MSWPVTSMPIAIWRPRSLTLRDLRVEVGRVDLDDELALAELVEPPPGGGLERRQAAEQLLADADGLPGDDLLGGVGREPREHRVLAPRRRRPAPRSRSYDERRRGLLGLDDRLDRQGQVVVEAKAVVEDGPQDGGDALAERGDLAVHQVLADHPVDVVAEPALVPVAAGVSPRPMSASAMPALSLLRSAKRSWIRVRRWSVRSSPMSPKSRKMICPVLGVDEHVAGVRVAVEEAVDEDLLDHARG